MAARYTAAPKGPPNRRHEDTVVDLSVQVGQLKLRNPILTASGTCGYGIDLLPHVLPEQLGGICTKGLSLLPRAGAPVPRLWEVPGGLLNAIGLANIGLQAFIKDKLPLLRQRGVTVIANVLGVSPEEFGELAARLNDEEGVAAIELNSQTRAAIKDKSVVAIAACNLGTERVIPGFCPTVYRDLPPALDRDRQVRRFLA